MRCLLLATLLVSPSLLVSCASTPADGSAAADPQALTPPPPPPPAPWTSDFLDPALLVADEIRIEGPPGLFEHFAVRVEPAYHERHEETTPNGYLQVVTVQSGAPAEVRGYLDQLELAAMRRISVLERPGEVPVTVLAVGEVYHVRTKTGEEQRLPELRLVGRRPLAPRSDG